MTTNTPQQGHDCPARWKHVRQREPVAGRKFHCGARSAAWCFDGTAIVVRLRGLPTNSVIVGGVADSLVGRPRFTQDIDAYASSWIDLGTRAGDRARFWDRTMPWLSQNVRAFF